MYIKNLKTTIDKVTQNSEKFQLVIHVDRNSTNGHRICYNTATFNQVALVIVEQQFEKWDMVIQSHDNQL